MNTSGKRMCYLPLTNGDFPCSVPTVIMLTYLQTSDRRLNPCCNRFPVLIPEIIPAIRQILLEHPRLSIRRKLYIRAVINRTSSLCRDTLCRQSDSHTDCQQCHFLKNTLFHSSSISAHVLCMTSLRRCAQTQISRFKNLSDFSDSGTEKGIRSTEFLTDYFVMQFCFNTPCHSRYSRLLFLCTLHLYPS